MQRIGELAEILKMSVLIENNPLFEWSQGLKFEKMCHEEVEQIKNIQEEG